MALASRLVEQANTFRSAIHRKRIIFHHLPKCGGSAITRPMRVKSITSFVKVDEEACQDTIAAEGVHDFMARHEAAHDMKRLLTRYYATRDIALIQGHVPFFAASEGEATARYDRITVLRDPVERFLSHYFWDKGRPNWNGFDLELPEFLETEQAQAFGSIMLRYLSSMPWPITDVPKALDMARTNAEKFTVIGRLEALDTFAVDMKRAFGWKLKIPVTNTGKVNSYETFLQEAGVRDRLLEVCAPDIQLYTNLFPSE